MTVSPPAAPLLGMYLTGGAFPGGPSAWPSGPTTNMSAQYQAWGQDWATYGGAFVDQCNAVGMIPYVELEPWHSGSAWNVTPLFSDITGGSWDTWLTGIGTAIAATGKPCILTFAHEFNVSGQYPWAQGMTGSGPSGGTLTAAEWIDGWKYVHDKVNSTAGGLVLWMWAPNTFTGGTTIDPTPYWPGSSYVDMVGLDGYPTTQWGASLGTFSGQFGPAVTAIRNLGWTDDIFISETNLAQMVSSGGESISSFVADMYAAGMSGIFEFETANQGEPSMSAAQWDEYNTAVAQYYGAPSGNPKIATLTAAFSGSSLPASLYLEPDASNGNPSGVISVSGGQLILDGGTYSDEGYYTSVNSNAVYDLTSSAVFCQVGAGESGTGDGDTGIGVYEGNFTDGYNYDITGGKLQVESTVGDVPTVVHAVTYDATSMAWLRIREASGTLYFETAPDGLTWTVQYSTGTETVGAWSAPATYLQMFYGSASGASKPTGTATFASLGIAPSSGGGGGGAPAPAAVAVAAPSRLYYPGARLTGTALRRIRPQAAVKYLAQAVASNATVLEADDALALQLEAGAVYYFRCALGYTGAASGSGDIKAGWSVPPGATMGYALRGNHGGAQTNGWWETQASVPGLNSLGTGTEVSLVMRGTVATASTPGPMQLLWCQHTKSTTDTTVLAAASLLAWRIL